MAVFPVQASYGYTASAEIKEALKVYDDLSYRRYVRSNAIHETRALVFDDISKTEYDDIMAFFIARKQETGTDDQFYIYDPDEVNEIDLDGSSSTGRHTAIFLDSRIEFTRDGPCNYSGSVNVLFLD
jgi:hypothetical protein